MGLAKLSDDAVAGDIECAKCGVTFFDAMGDDCVPRCDECRRTENEGRCSACGLIGDCRCCAKCGAPENQDCDCWVAARPVTNDDGRVLVMMDEIPTARVTTPTEEEMVERMQSRGRRSNDPDDLTTSDRMVAGDYCNDGELLSLAEAA